VQNELYVGNIRGRESYIDIYLEFKKAVVVIENKIWAGDQPEQLCRYASYAEKMGRPVFIFYLTLDGHPPSKNSLGGLREDKVALISYEKNILSWVERCLRETDSFVNINQALRQYNCTINQLSGRTLEAHDMNEIKERIKKHPDILRQAGSIRRALDEVCFELEESFLQKLEEELCERIKGTLLQDSKWTSGSYPLKDVTDRVQLVVGKNNKVLFLAAFPGAKTNPNYRVAAEKILNDVSNNITDGGHWGSIRYLLQGESGFSNDKFVSDMLDESEMKKMIAECADKTVDFLSIIDGVEGCWNP